jgi:tetratricopeptide (TPR) repeat protein
MKFFSLQRKRRHIRTKRLSASLPVIDASRARSHQRSGAKFRAQGLYKQAAACYEQAVRLKPSDAEAHYTLGLMYLHLNDHQAATEQYKVLKTIDKDLADVLNCLIQVESLRSVTSSS